MLPDSVIEGPLPVEALHASNDLLLAQVAVRVERVGAREQRVEDDTELPHVYLLAVGLVVEHLRRHIRLRAALAAQKPVIKRHRHAEIAEQHIRVLSTRLEHEILWLYVSVADV